MRRRWRLAAVVLLLVAGAGAVAWRHQSALIGRAAEWYLSRTTDPARQRAVVGGLHRTLLMQPPADVLVPELFDVVTLVSRRVATGEMSLDWAAHLYTTYVRDLQAQRPKGVPRRTPDEIRAEIDRYVAFYAIRKRPDVRGVTIVLGTGDDVITLEEIEAAERAGEEFDPRTGKLR
ncbi:MAG TPA: hypothetical protein VNO26_03140 [Candidatus Limnocylindria bacterium]|nr:hypothetical protein [Candidatus Limnocylindria bacterium]